MRAAVALLAPLVACAALMQDVPHTSNAPRVLADGRIADTFLVDTDDGQPTTSATVATVAYATRLHLETGTFDVWHVWVRGLRDTLLLFEPADLAPDEAFRRARDDARPLAMELLTRARCSCDTLRPCPERRRSLACT